MDTLWARSAYVSTMDTAMGLTTSPARNTCRPAGMGGATILSKCPHVKARGRPRWDQAIAVT